MPANAPTFTFRNKEYFVLEIPDGVSVDEQCHLCAFRSLDCEKLRAEKEIPNCIGSPSSKQDSGWISVFFYPADQDTSCLAFPSAEKASPSPSISHDGKVYERVQGTCPECAFGGKGACSKPEGSEFDCQRPPRMFQLSEEKAPELLSDPPEAAGVPAPKFKAGDPVFWIHVPGLARALPESAGKRHWPVKVVDSYFLPHYNARVYIIEVSVNKSKYTHRVRELQLAPRLFKKAKPIVTPPPAPKCPYTGDLELMSVPEVLTLLERSSWSLNQYRRNGLIGRVYKAKDPRTYYRRADVLALKEKLDQAQALGVSVTPPAKPEEPQFKQEVIDFSKPAVAQAALPEVKLDNVIASANQDCVRAKYTVEVTAPAKEWNDPEVQELSLLEILKRAEQKKGAWAAFFTLESRSELKSI